MTKRQKKKRQPNLQIIPLGGLGEVGRNMTLLEYKRKILIIDMGLRFPEETMPGIDCIIPNISYLKKKRSQIVGAVFTHGHYDHIGAIPYIVEELGNHFPLFTAPLTKGIILKRQEDFPKKPSLDIKEVKNGNHTKLGPFDIEWVQVNHNIPETFALFIRTPVGNVFYASDFKLDPTPIYDPPIDLKRLRMIGNKGVLLFMSDSTGAEEEGHSLSEKEIMENLEEIFKKAKGRIVAASFASLLNRIQQIITLSEKYKRKVAIDGYSMKKNIEIAQKLGYLKINSKTRIEPKEVKNCPDSKVTVLCTGAQGEEQAVLMRLANQEHQSLRLKKGDTVILSSSVVPGNERSVQMLKDNLLRQGAKVFHYEMMDIHSGGHARQEELKQVIQILKPEFLIPIHGQYSMLVAHAELAEQVKIPARNILIAENGNIINLTPTEISVARKEAPSNYVMVDGLGVGDVGEVVLRDRKVLAEDGIFVVIVVVDRQTGKVRGSPDIISRGFVYLKESKHLLSETRNRVKKIINNASGAKVVSWVYLKDEIKNKIGSYLYSKTERRPMVLPVIIEV